MGRTVVIYAGRRTVNLDNEIRLIDSFQAVSESPYFIVQCNLRPAVGDYEARGREMAEHLKKRGIDGFAFRNSYRYCTDERRVVRVEVVEGEKNKIRGVPRDELMRFRRGLLKQFIGV